MPTPTRRESRTWFTSTSNQRFDDLSRRFDGLEQRMDQLHADMLQMRNRLVWLFGLLVSGFIGSIVLILFRDVMSK